MPTKKKRLTQREKAERAAMKKQLQAEGVLPPDKPRLNRKKFARETWAEWEEFLKGDPIRAEVSLLRAVEFIAGPELPAVTPEQVGVYTLSVICRRYYWKSSAKYYNALAKYNGIKNPHLIYPGTTLRIPPESVLLGVSA